MTISIILQGLSVVLAFCGLVTHVNHRPQRKVNFWVMAYILINLSLLVKGR